MSRTKIRKERTPDRAGTRTEIVPPPLRREAAGNTGWNRETAMAVLLHPLSRLVLSALALTAVLRWLFFLFAPRIWAMRQEFPVQEITSWARWAMEDRDGVEPQVLLLLTLVLAAGTGAAAVLLDRLSSRTRTIAVLTLLA